MDIAVLPLKLSDLDRVLEIEKQWNPTPWSYQSFHNEIENKENICLVAKNEDQILGYAIVQIVDHQASLLTLAVDRMYARSGIAKRLMHSLLQKVVEGVAKEIILEVRESNSAAQSLYSQYGFSVVGKRKGYYQNNHEDALIMSCLLCKDC